ncbi:TonB-dependent receptor [Sphingomonas sp. Leaf62]|uniref:TonB-dependent receptor n=1 Tax=Sphingomonas sp. Leaf62 TaxID=1736228 RepID=UPI0006F4FB6B|nr:TonB-dependent receptor [Sphingomonas sp. Leaf62]KQN72086.1 TonB-dependent receptor [Sphingomonas sp. Leaf62]
MTSFANIRGMRLRGAASGLALIVALGSAPALAQVAPKTGNTTTTDEVRTSPTDPLDQEAEILVTGTRASLQSANARKKNADTVVDSIVAEDIASFPDKNVGEALARITGVQLQRDFGEGSKVSIRGVEPDLNRIEINGVSQQAPDGSRSGDFRELAVELVKSIDVYKGYTVDLTEGGIGGTVRVETRRPLELTKPLFSVKGEAQRLNLTEKWRPRFNLTAGRSDLFDGRLGVLFNVTHSVVDTRGDSVANTNWQRYFDFDRSTEKTVANPAYANFGTYESCAGTTGTTAALATSNRLACEDQFFDWSPGSVRYRNQERTDARTSVDFQAQVQLADNFSAWGQVQLNYRNQNLRDTNYGLNMGGGLSGAGLSLSNGDFTRYNLDAALAANAAGGTSRARPTQSFVTTEDHILTSWTSALNGVTPTGSGAIANSAGASNIVGVQRRDFSFDSNTRYLQTGFKWDLDRMKMIFLASRSEGSQVNETNLVSITTGVSGISFDRRNDAGLPVVTFPSNFDPADIGSYGDNTRRGANGQLLVQSGPSVQYRPSQADSAEDQLKLDVDYDLDWGFLKSIKFGGQYRNQDLVSYGAGGGRLLSPAVTAVPAAGIVGRPAVFQYNNNVSLSTVIGSPPATGPAAGVTYFTPAQYQQFLAANSGLTGGAPLFTGIKGIDGAPPRLAQPLFDFANLSRFYDLSNFNQSRVREADGLPQIPGYIISEKIVAGYLRANFGTEVFGMNLTGNAGMRYTYTKDDSTSSNTRRESRVRPGTGVPGIPAVIEVVTVAVQEVTLSNDYHDWLPAANLSLEVRPNLFVRATYAKNLARPRPSDLSPAVNCVIDLADTIAGEDTCSAGNPALKPYRADQYDLNAAWYPNADTVVSVGYYYKDIKSFILPASVIAGVDLFNDGVLYTVRQPRNGFGAKLDGFEFSASTVFSFLPAPLDGFGVNGNFTFSRALNSTLTNQATGESIDDFPGLSKFTYNGSIFYDKDWLNARVSYNKRTDYLIAAVDASSANNPVYRRGETYVDAKVQFRITPQYSMFFEALNLTNELSRSYIDDARPIEYTDSGRRIFIGAQFKL